MLLIALLFFTFYAAFLLLEKKLGRKHFPPGPLSLPLVGSFLNLLFVPEAKMCDQFIQYGKKYGKIYSFAFGRFPGIVITDPKLAREVLANKVFSGKPTVETVLIGYKGLLRGLACQDGRNWKMLRSFTFKALPKLGLGKITMQGILDDEALYLVEDLRNEGEFPTSTLGRFSLPIINILWQTIGEKRLDEKDEKVRRVLDAIHGALQPSFASSAIFMPWVARWFPKLVGWDRFTKMGDCTNDFINSFVEEKLANPSTFESSDFVGMFAEKIIKTTDESSCFYGDVGKENLVATLVDMFVATTETCSTTLSWLCLYLALNPSKQEKLRKEIHNIVGREKPKLSDATRMPYTEAVIMETMRLSSVVPLNLIHRSLEDTRIGRWRIPEDTLVSVNIYAIHHDPDNWVGPEEFRPERFLAHDNSILHPEAYIPFSAGPRVCPGVSFAKEAIFTFVVTILQSFIITWDGSGRKPSTDAKLSIIRVPMEHKLIFKKLP